MPGRIVQGLIEAKSMNPVIVLDEIDKPQVEALYSRLGFTYLDDKDFFGHTMKHMVRQLDMTGNYYRHFKGNV